MVDVAISSGKGEEVFAIFETILDRLTAEKKEDGDRAAAGVLDILAGLAGYAHLPLSTMPRSTPPLR